MKINTEIKTEILNSLYSELNLRVVNFNSEYYQYDELANPLRTESGALAYRIAVGLNDGDDEIVRECILAGGILIKASHRDTVLYGALEQLASCHYSEKSQYGLNHYVSPKEIITEFGTVGCRIKRTLRFGSLHSQVPEYYYLGL